MITLSTQVHIDRQKNSPKSQQGRVKILGIVGSEPARKVFEKCRRLGPLTIGPEIWPDQ